MRDERQVKSAKKMRGGGKEDEGGKWDTLVSYYYGILVIVKYESRESHG